MIRSQVYYLSIDFEPNVALSTTFDNRANGHETNDESLSFLNRNMHFLPDIWTAQEITSGNDTGLHQYPITSDKSKRNLP